MKLALSFVALTLAMHTAVAAPRNTDRYTVTFKSEQGFQAMSQYFQTESAAPMARMQKSLKFVRALVLKTKNTAALESLKNHPEVAAIEPERFTPVPKPTNGFKMARMAPVQMMMGEGDNAGPDTGAGTPALTPGASTPWGILAVKAGDAWADSAAGANARVMVLDTGVDKNHPAISGNFEKGRNFVEDENTGDTDVENFADVEGHGTHCSGTILGAYNQATGFTGVAPKAKLLMGRICGTEGCSSVALLEGIDWGISEHVDVISMSLGGPIASQSELTAMTNAEKAGIVVVAASGNSATDPNYSYDRKDPKCRSNNPFQPSNCGVSYPGAFPTVVAVGAVDSTLAKTNFSQWGPELDVVGPGAAVISSVPMGSGRESVVKLTVAGVEKEVKSAAFAGTELFPTALVNEIVVVPGLGKPENFAAVQVAGKFALVARGEISFADKVKNAMAAKAVGVLIYNNAPGLMQGALSQDGSLINFPVVMIEQTEGLAIIEALKTAGQRASAAILLAPSDYASFDGTSMATPHVAGVVALIRSANKKLTPAQVRQILASTSQALSPNDTNQFGAGLVQADQAVKAALKF